MLPTLYSNLIFFGLAISTGVDGMTKGLNYLRLSLAISGDKEKLKREQKRLEADFDSKNEAFIQAVNNMTFMSILCDKSW